MKSELDKASDAVHTAMNAYERHADQQSAASINEALEDLEAIVAADGVLGPGEVTAMAYKLAGIAPPARR